MRLDVNGININVREAGSGDQAYVFMHFWGASSLEWSQVIEGLSGAYRCVAFDLRGMGLSDAPASGYRMTDLADDALGVIAAMKLKQYVLVGHSMGGKAAQVLAARRPDALKGLALVASAPAGPMHIGDTDRDQMRGAYASRESVSWVIENVLTSAPISDVDREAFIVDALRLSDSARDGWIEIGSRENYFKEVANVNVPVTIIAGEEDKIDSVAVVKTDIIPSFQSPETHRLAGRGHLLPLEAPVEVVEILGNFGANVFA